MSTAAPTETAKPADKPAEKPPEVRQDSFRETVESIVIAFVLAFLFRSFEAEAFVIPTGSMAPTLTGLHKDLAGRKACVKCGHEYFVGASEEVEAESGAQRYPQVDRMNPATGKVETVDDRTRPFQVASGTCPVCGYTMEIGPNNPQHEEYYSYTGDRILVSKFAYQFSEPERWDVVVFKFPESAQKNYIKRLIGKPHETIKIYQGDIYVRDDNSNDEQFHIAPKPPGKVRAMMQMVYDNDRALPYLPSLGWPARWSSDGEDAGDGAPQAGGWKSQAEGHEFATAGVPGSPAWLRYRHYFPSFKDWETLENAQKLAQTQPGAKIPPDYPVKPQLVSDFTAYNSAGENPFYNYDRAEIAAKNNLPPPRTAPDYYGGAHWVGDLVLDCELHVKPGSSGGEARLELIRAGESFECRFDLATGVATILREGTPLAVSKGKTAVVGTGSWDLSFANVDRRLTLWVNGSVVEMVRTDNGSVDNQVAYPAPQEAVPTLRDLSPAGVAVSGVQAEVKHLRLYRDIYYIVATEHFHGRLMIDFSADMMKAPADIHTNPEQWEKYRLLRESPHYQLKADQFLVLGDNSAKSADSRMWQTGPVVPRDLMIGKALFIFWPHAWETPWNKEVSLGGFGSIRVPFYPNFKRMTLIR